MIRFTASILKFGEQGEKTGWTYIVIPANVAQKLRPGNKRSFRVKGELDAYPIKAVALLPMGEGDFIMPLNGAMRKALKKQKGDKLIAQLQEDKSDFVFDADLMTCLNDEPSALQFFKKLPGSHQRYFSKWIQSAKTDATKAKRIAQAVNALARGLGYAQMLRALKTQREQ
ncbi:MAG TPA: YdeI/OmpD-associated family protein [Bacteroidia bacterium]|jgi:hypothetical protein